MEQKLFEKIKENMLKNNKNLSVYACFDNDAIRLKEDKEDFRNPFFRDIDRIIYTLAYTRYIDKTQVFSLRENDHISRRMTHVQMVSKIARTIGRALNLNEDLIEASSLGHDLGHTPFGHMGEKILNKLSLKYNMGYFNHNVQSVRVLMNLENYGEGKNISLQTLDAILAHNGEIEQNLYKPVKKTKEEFLEEYEGCYKDKEQVKKIVPMTLEGCVVRISDIIAYIGKDFEEACMVSMINKNEIPEEIVRILGNTNKEIVNTIIKDIINNSYNKDYIKLSDKVYNAISKLKAFNYEHIYNKANVKLTYVEKAFEKMFEKLLNDLNENKKSNILTFKSEMNEEYRKNNSNERIVIDYISGMTDDYFINECMIYNIEIK